MTMQISTMFQMLTCSSFLEQRLGKIPSKSPLNLLEILTMNSNDLGEHNGFYSTTKNISKEKKSGRKQEKKHS